MARILRKTNAAAAATPSRAQPDIAMYVMTSIGAQRSGGWLETSLFRPRDPLFQRDG
jgi:hypothetical protein